MNQTYRTQQQEAVARLLDRVAWLMDRAIPIPGTRATVGLDAILGLLPVGGDLLTGVVQVGLVLVALGHYRVPTPVVIRMLGNVLVDVGVGCIPILGDLFDVAFKANTRNMRLLDPYRAHPEAHVVRPDFPASITIPLPPGGIAWGLMLAIAVVLIGALGLVLVGFVTVLRWILHSS